MNKKISIVGGGASGWLTALYVQNLYKGEADITLIESDEIGILGAGEGSVPFTLDFLRRLNIDIDELIVKVNGTHKIGIIFENWNGDGKNYIHDFFSGDTRKFFDFPEDYMAYSIDNGVDINELFLAKKLAYNNKAPFNKETNGELVSYSFHFDAHLLADYLRSVAISRGVNRIEGIVKDFTLTGADDISEIILDNGDVIKTEFVFDCSGFKRLIIGKLYNTPWISYKDKLTVNSALTFQLPQDIDNIKPYTKAIAMKYGWMWQIPLQNRWGCGYVFDNNYINEVEAKAEIESLLGHEIQSNRVLEFDAGRYNSLWVNNCIAVGLSGGFIEPLEATSIVMSAISLESLTRLDLDYKNYTKIGVYNVIIAELTNNIMEFLQYHYFSKRNDTEFWNNIKKDDKVSKSLKRIIHELHNHISINTKIDSIFSLQNWLMVGYGLGMITDDKLIEKYNNKLDRSFLNEHYEKEIIPKSKELFDKAYTESEYLKIINKKYE